MATHGGRKPHASDRPKPGEEFLHFTLGVRVADAPGGCDAGQERFARLNGLMELDMSRRFVIVSGRIVRIQGQNTGELPDGVGQRLFLDQLHCQTEVEKDVLRLLLEHLLDALPANHVRIAIHDVCATTPCLANCDERDSSDSGTAGRDIVFNRLSCGVFGDGSGVDWLSENRCRTWSRGQSEIDHPVQPMHAALTQADTHLTPL